MEIFTENIADRLQDNVSYKFARIKKWKAEALKMHPELPLIDLGVGEPDRPADPGIVEIMAEEAGKPENRFYADNGIVEFQTAAAGYLERVYGLAGLNPLENIIHGIGSKPVLAMLPLLFINPGDVALMTTPGYPVLGAYTRYLGGEVYHLPLYAGNNFYPDLAEVPQEVLKRAKLFYINYPNNPTGQIGTKKFFEHVVEFAAKNKIVVVSDASYAALRFDGERPLSFLSVDGAMEVGVEVHSLSKAFNMTGWRLAFLAGDAQVVSAYGKVKDNTDSGQFRAIQKAGVYALNHPEITVGYCEKYARRFDMLVEVLNEAGFNVQKPKATFYCYAPAPKGTRNGDVFNNAESAAEFLIREAAISTVPWDDAGSFLRMAVTFEANNKVDEIKVMAELKQRLLKLGFIF